MNDAVWFRNDLRNFDHPALEACSANRAFFVRYTCSPKKAALIQQRLEFLAQYVELTVLDTVDQLIEAAQGLDALHVTADYTPSGLRRDKKVAEQVNLVAHGSAYAVPPGTVLTGQGTHYKVFTPFYKAWSECGWDAPSTPPNEDDPAWQHWLEFLDQRLEGYADNRDRPDMDGTSRISAFLATGSLHPRSLLESLSGADAPAADRDAFARELAFREFYGDFVYHVPESVKEDVNPKFKDFQWNEVEHCQEDFRAWCEGRTGYPIVDAGMRQLNETGWMHNRVRMIVASFLTKDLHLPWQVGAQYFRDTEIDYDEAINQHSWQWCAGTGTDASPYFRVFNPMTQGAKFDPDAKYIKKWVPELELCSPTDIHKMRKLPAAYPAPLVDHAEERLDALARYERIR